MHPRHRFVLLLAVFALLLPLLAACGDDDDDDDNGGAGGQTEATATSGDGGGGDGEALKIGVLLPFTGDLSDFGAAMEQAAQLAADEINEAGGVNGQPLELVTGDTATSPQQGVEEARRLVDVEGISGLVGPASSGTVLQVVESVTGPEGVVTISPSATSPALTVANDNDYFFRTTISDAAQGVILAELALELGFDTACVMYVNNAYGQGLDESFKTNYEANGGTIQADVPHEQQQASYASELSTCTEGNPDVVAAISYPESASVYFREALESQNVSQFIFTDGPKSDDLFEELGWENFEGMYGTAPGSVDSATGDAFNAAFEAAYGELPPLPFLRETYDAVYLIALAAEKANSTDRTAIRDALRDISNEPGETINPGPDGWTTAVSTLDGGGDINYEGAAGSAEFDDAGDILKGVIEIWKIEGGAIVTEDSRQIDLTS